MYVVAIEISNTRFNVSSGDLLGVVVDQTKWYIAITMQCML